MRLGDGQVVVVADGRPVEGAGAVDGPAAEHHILDVLRDDLVPVFAGADAVVHLAGSPDLGPDDPTGRAVVAGTRRVLEAADAAGVPLDLDQFDALARRTPLIANLRPSGRFLMEDF